MDFDSLPDKIFLQIFHYLPFKDQIGLGGVNTRFNEMSNLAIANMQNLELDDDLTNYFMFTTWTLPSLLDSCSNTLQRIYISNDFRLGDAAFKALSEYVYPRVNEIDVSYYGFSTKAIEAFAQLVKACPKLRRLICDIKMIDHTDNFLASITGSVSNLKHLNIDYTGMSIEVLNGFFASVPRLESMEFGTYNEFSIIQFENITKFWHLLYLRSLALRLEEYLGTNSDVLKAISVGCPNLEKISIEPMEIEAQDFRLLPLFKNLQELEIGKKFGYGWYDVSYDNETVFGDFGDCPRLVNLNLSFGYLPANLFIDIALMCPQLRDVFIAGFVEIKSDPGNKSTAINIVESLLVLGGGKKININYGDSDDGEIWEKKSVKKALKQLKESGGPDIQFK